MEDMKPMLPWGISPGLDIISLDGWRSQRPVRKAQKCCACGQCCLYCPTGCVSYQDSHFETDLTYCKGCGICARVCPVSAIAMKAEI